MRRSLVIALALVLAGCPAPPTRPVATKSPGAPKPAVASPGSLNAATITLSGEVRLLSNNGAAIISDNGGGIISDNGGGIVSNNTGNVVGNNGGNAIARRQLLALGELRLAEAVVEVLDAAGNPVKGPDGQPLTATTDAKGAYQLRAALPPGNLVLRVKLAKAGVLPGGQLRAMLPRGVATQRVDAASSIGAAYVLGKFVQGDQATFDKLPAAQAGELQQVLAAAQGGLADLSYEEPVLLATGEALRKQVPAVDAKLEEIRALLLGQTNLGAGRAATRVPLYSANAIAMTGGGTLVIGEYKLGRLREVTPDGKLQTLADVAKGRCKQNFPQVADMAVGPDDAVYVVPLSDRRVWRVTREGKGEVVLGALDGTVGAVGPATAIDVRAHRVAIGPTGIAYVDDSPIGGTPRVLAIEDGQAATAFQGAEAGWQVNAIAALKDGALIVHERQENAATRRLWRVPPGGGAPEALPLTGLDDYAALDDHFLAAPDGGFYAIKSFSPWIKHRAPDGTVTVAVGQGGPPATQVLQAANGMTVGPDGTLYVLDARTQLIHALTKDGRFDVVAGTRDLGLDPTNLRDVPINGPSGVAFDPQGRMYLSESGSNLVQRFDGTRLENFAGGGDLATLKARGATEGDAALGSWVEDPASLAWIGDELTIFENVGRIRRVDAQGRLTTRIGLPGLQFYAVGVPFAPPPGTQVPPTSLACSRGTALATGPGGQLYWTTADQGHLVRQRADGQVEWVAGVGGELVAADYGAILNGTPDTVAAGEARFANAAGLAFAPDGTAIVAETAGMALRRVSGLDGASPMVTRLAGGLPVQELVDHGAAHGGPAEEGKPARDAFMAFPAAVCVGPDGTIYVAEMGSAYGTLLSPVLAGGTAGLFEGLPTIFPRVRKIAPDGTLTTIAGPGGTYFPDPAAEEGLVLPTGLAIDPKGRLVILDGGSNLVHVLPAGTF